MRRGQGCKAARRRGIRQEAVRRETAGSKVMKRETIGKQNAPDIPGGVLCVSVYTAVLSVSSLEIFFLSLTAGSLGSLNIGTNLSHPVNVRMRRETTAM